VISQRGGFVMGLVAGLLIGLALALGVALYITKAPVPFIDKVPQRTAEQDSAETERNRTWDPNAPLAGKAAPRVGAAASGAVAPSASAPAEALRAPAAAAPASAAKPASRDPAAILAGGAAPPARPGAPAADPFVYFVQAGAYTRTDEAEQQRARLALVGQSAKVVEREQAGRTVYRVRLGPFPTRDEADALQVKLQEQKFETQIVRVERP
jgi:cell division protein FtsN